MNSKILLPLSILVLLVSGCGTSYYYAEFLHPSKKYIPSRIFHVGVMNRAAVQSTPAMVTTNGMPMEQISGLTLMTVQRTVDQLKKQIKDVGRYDPITMTWPADSIKNQKFRPSKLTPDMVDSLCTSYGLEGIIALEGIEMVINTRGNVDVTTSTDPNGTPTRVPEFNSESNVTYTVFWRFYDNLHRSVGDEFQETYQLSFTKVAFTEQEVLNMGSSDLNLADVAYMAGVDYYQRVAPYWKEDYREYYQTGSPEFYQIGQQLDYDGDWESAALKWYNFTENPEPKLAHRAYYNLAVASEMLGNPREALDWLNQAIAIKDTKDAAKYKKTLEKQILIYDVVNKQLGIR